MATSASKWDHLEGPARLLDWRSRSKTKDGGKLTQQEAANLIGCDLAQYNAFENGRERPGLDWAVAIERVTHGKVKPLHWVEIADGKARVA